MIQKVLVMGGSYFIGKKIVDSLLDNGYSVFVLNRGTKVNTDNRIVNLICDRNDPIQMKEILENYEFDIVIDVSGLDKSQAEILCNAINIKKIKTFLFISSSAVYDLENLAIPFPEDAKLKENKYWTLYGKNKIETEAFYTNKFKDLDANLIILRPPYVYGEDNYVQRESFVFEHICNDKPIIVPKSNLKLQFVYVNDLANIVAKLINIPLDHVSIFNVGDKDAVSVKEWIECCEKVVGKKSEIMEYDYIKANINVREFFPFADCSTVLDVKKINRILNIETDFEQGLKNAYDWYCENKKNILFKENVSQNEVEILKLMRLK